ncbi:MAG TPA: flagellar hook-length control protein FliK [Steroidobacteraceae bacterium]
MNATLPVSQTPIASDPAQPSAAGAANSMNSGGKGQDFAAALSSAGPKPVRKAAGAKAADAGTVGGHLPAAGNLSPPPAPPPAPPLTTGSAAPAADALTAAGPPAASILGAQAVAADQSSGAAPVDSPVAAPGAQGTTSPGAGFGLALGLPVEHAGEAGAPGGDRAAAPSSATAVAVPGDAAPAKGAARAAVAVASTTQARAAAGTAAGAANKPATVATTAAIDSAASRPTPASRAADGSAPPATPSSTNPSTSTGASTNTDANAQAVTAAAMSAATTGTVGPGDTGTAGGADLSALPTNESATPATAAKSSGPAGPNGPPVLVPVPAPVISAARPATEVSAKAAAAAPAGTALAGAGAADKRASGGTGDSLLSGTSVDGSAAGAAQLGVNPTAVADATTAPPALKVAAGVETPEFGHGLADRVSWMVDNNLNGAKLQVNPPQLGPIEVRIAVQGSHAQVWLASHSAVTRDALESSSSKLREMLGAQGFGQVSVDISQRSYQDRSAYSQPYESMPSASRSPSAAAVQSTASSLARISSGAVDAYA